MNDPQEFFRSIHIAGTNGKGSVTHMLAAIYQANGYKVGIFTSPHIIDFRERIKINGQMISKEEVVAFIDANESLIKELGATFFEITTAMAFHSFKKHEVDIAIVETGLGGRLDSTNVLLPELSIITNIGLDHTQFLGDTLKEIAQEKAGIIKENVPVLIGKKQDEIHDVFLNISKERSAQLHLSTPHELKTDLIGDFQKQNANTAFSAVLLLQDQFPIAKEKCLSGLLQVKALTNFMGRFECIAHEPDLYIDAAHNFDGVQLIIEEVQKLKSKNVHFIYGASNDKDLYSIFNIFPKNWNYYFTEFASQRSSTEEQLTILGAAQSLDFTTFKTPALALKSAKILAESTDIIIACGSFFLLEDILVANSQQT